MEALWVEAKQCSKSSRLTSLSLALWFNLLIYKSFSGIPMLDVFVVVM
jgi:hypothetical protein